MADAGRVIAGTARGRRLLAPGPGTRPFADRVKQALFAILEPDLPGAAVLDLFAGSGAGGIEALSRGAARAVFVERDPSAAAVIRENLTRCGLAERARVRRSEVAAYLGSAAGGDGPFDVVLVDPPYADRDALERVLERLGERDAGAILRPGARLVAKHFWRDAPPPVVGLLASDRERRFGESALTFYRRGGAGPGDEIKHGEDGRLDEDDRVEHGQDGRAEEGR
jgi:16S rRNA (guanine(966)-N(2))-methyltransferase RsmD